MCITEAMIQHLIDINRFIVNLYTSGEGEDKHKHTEAFYNELYALIGL